MEEKKKKVKQQTNRTGCEPTHTFPCSMVAGIEVVTGMAEVDPVVRLLSITPQSTLRTQVGHVPSA